MRPSSAPWQPPMDASMVAAFASTQQLASRPMTHRDPRLAIPASSHGSSLDHSDLSGMQDEEEDGQQHHDAQDSHAAWGDGESHEQQRHEDELEHDDDDGGRYADERRDSVGHTDGEGEEEDADEAEEHDDDDDPSAAYEESMLGDQGEPVQVALRCRPLLPSEQNYAASAAVRSPSGLTSPTSGASRICVTVQGKQVLLGKSRVFEFDHAFGPEATQQEVYEGCAAGLVRAAFKGYNATIFAYGQTGSGKTFTMGPGTSQRASDQGIIPRVVHDLYARVNVAAGRGVTVTTKVSYIEIYQEELKDLLHPTGPPAGAGTGGGATGAMAAAGAGFGRGAPSSSTTPSILIREDAQGGVSLVGVRDEIVASYGDIARVLTRGNLGRTTGSTKMNLHSSRSHSIFTITIEQRSSVQQTGGDSKTSSASRPPGRSRDGAVTTTTAITRSKFHLVDLAGSERAKRTGAEGVRFKESVHINRGLLALANVIQALVAPATTLGVSGEPAPRHVPYRDSKLTRLLQGSLGGDSRTLMIACVSPHDSHFEETHTTIKYAARARRIRNNARAHVSEEIVAAAQPVQTGAASSTTGRAAAAAASSATSDADVRGMREEIARLHEQLQASARPSRPLGAADADDTHDDADAAAARAPPFLVDGYPPASRHLALASSFALLHSSYALLVREHGWLLSGLGFFVQSLGEMKELEGKRDQVKERVIQLRKQYDLLVQEGAGTAASPEHAEEVSSLSAEIKAAQKSYVSFRDLLAKLREDLDHFMQIYSRAKLEEMGQKDWMNGEELMQGSDVGDAEPHRIQDPQEEINYAQRVLDFVREHGYGVGGSGGGGGGGGGEGDCERHAEELVATQQSLESLQSEHNALRAAFEEAQADLRFDDEIFEEKVRALRDLSLKNQEAQAHIEELREANRKLHGMMQDMSEEVKRKMQQQQQGGGAGGGNTARSTAGGAQMMPTPRPGTSAGPGAARLSSPLPAPQHVSAQASPFRDATVSAFRDHTEHLARAQEEGDEVLTAEHDDDDDGADNNSNNNNNASLIAQLRSQYTQLCSQLSSLRQTHASTMQSVRGLQSLMASRRSTFLARRGLCVKQLRDLRIQRGMKEQALAELREDMERATDRAAAAAAAAARTRSRSAPSSPSGRSNPTQQRASSGVSAANARALAEAEQHYQQLEQDLALKQRLLAALSPRASSARGRDVRADIESEVHTLEKALKDVGAHLESIQLNGTPAHSPTAADAAAAAAGTSSSSSSSSREHEEAQALLAQLTQEVHAAQDDLSALDSQSREVEAQLRALEDEYHGGQEAGGGGSSHASSRAADKKTLGRLEQELESEKGMIAEMEEARGEMAQQLRDLGVEVNEGEANEQTADADASTDTSRAPPKSAGPASTTAAATAATPLPPAVLHTLRRKSQWVAHQVSQFLLDSSSLSQLAQLGSEERTLREEARQLAQTKATLVAKSLRESGMGSLADMAQGSSSASSRPGSSHAANATASLNQSLASLNAQLGRIDEKSSSLKRQSRQQQQQQRGGGAQHSEARGSLQHELEQLDAERTRLESARGTILSQLRPSSSAGSAPSNDLLNGPLLTSLLRPEDARQVAEIDEQLDDLQVQIAYKQQCMQDMDTSTQQAARPGTAAHSRKATGGAPAPLPLDPEEHRRTFLTKLEGMFDVSSPEEARFVAQEYCRTMLEHASEAARSREEVEALRREVGEKDAHLTEMEALVSSMIQENDQRLADLEQECQNRIRQAAEAERQAAAKRIRAVEEDLKQARAELHRMRGGDNNGGISSRSMGAHSPDVSAIHGRGNDGSYLSVGTDVSMSKSPVQKLQTLKSHMHRRQSLSNAPVIASDDSSSSGGGGGGGYHPADHTHQVSQRAFAPAPAPTRSFTPAGLPGHSTLGGRPAQTPLLYNQSPSTTPRAGDQQRQEQDGLGVSRGSVDSRVSNSSHYGNPTSSRLNSHRSSSSSTGDFAEDADHAAAQLSTLSHASSTSPGRHAQAGTGVYSHPLSPASLRRLADSQQQQQHQHQQHPPLSHSSLAPAAPAASHPPQSAPRSPASSTSPPLSTEDRQRMQLALLKRKQSLRSSQIQADRLPQQTHSQEQLLSHAQSHSPSPSQSQPRSQPQPQPQPHSPDTSLSDSHRQREFNQLQQQYRAHHQQQVQLQQQQRKPVIPQLQLSAAHRNERQADDAAQQQQQQQQPAGASSTSASSSSHAPPRSHSRLMPRSGPGGPVVSHSSVGRVERALTSPSPSAR